MKSFEFLQKDEEFKKEVGSYPCYRVEEFPDANELINSDQVITRRKTITIRFDYPLTNKTSLTFKRKDGFTVKDFFRCVYQGYKKIYKEEGEDPGMIQGMFNRQTSHGKYGIWGHVMSDLYLEGAWETKPGVFKLSIGS